MSFDRVDKYLPVVSGVISSLVAIVIYVWNTSSHETMRADTDEYVPGGRVHTVVIRNAETEVV
jgi:hypothetical protein